MIGEAFPMIQTFEHVNLKDIVVPSSVHLLDSPSALIHANAIVSSLHENNPIVSVDPINSNSHIKS